MVALLFEPIGVEPRRRCCWVGSTQFRTLFAQVAGRAADQDAQSVIARLLSAHESPSLESHPIRQRGPRSCPDREPALWSRPPPFSEA